MRTLFKRKITSRLLRKTKPLGNKAIDAALPKRGISLRKKVLIAGAAGAGVFGSGAYYGRKWSLGLGGHEKTQKRLKAMDKNLQYMNHELLNMQLKQHKKKY